jgi:hypothetical protein
MQFPYPADGGRGMLQIVSAAEARLAVKLPTWRTQPINRLLEIVSPHFQAALR